MSATRRQLSHTKPQKTPKTVTTHSRNNIIPYLRRFFRRYGSCHLQAALLSLGQIARTPVTSAMIVIVIGIAFTFPMTLLVLLKNVSSITQHWDGHSPIVLYLKSQVDPHEAQALGKQLTKISGIEKVDYISPAQGLADFQQQSGFNQMLSVLKENPLPSVLVVTPQSTWQTSTAMASLLDTLKQLPQVDIAQLDLTWVKRLNALLQLASRATYALAILLSLGILFIIGSTIHLATERHRDEIFVYQLVGASNAFIRRPFLYTGMWYGLIGGIIACILVVALFIWMNAPTQLLAKLYGSDFVLHTLNVEEGIHLLLLGIVLGWLGSWAAVYRHLKG